MDLSEFLKWCSAEMREGKEELEACLSCLCRHLIELLYRPTFLFFFSLAIILFICLENNSFWEKQEKNFHLGEIITISLQVGMYFFRGAVFHIGGDWVL